VDADGIVGVCNALGLRHGRVRDTKRGPNISMACPLAAITHGDPDDRNKSCSVSVDPDGLSYAKCFSWNCGYNGTFFGLLQKAILGMPTPPEHLLEMLERIAETEQDNPESRARRMREQLEIQQGEESNPKPLPPREVERDVLEEAVFAPFSRKIPKYAVDRGVDKEAAAAWDLGYDEGQGRLVFPVRRGDGALVGMTGRITPEAQCRAANRGVEVTKYHNYSGLNKTRYLYGVHTWTDKKLPIVLVEGPLDAVRTWMALRDRGVNVAATMGEGFSSDHRRIVRGAWPPVVYIFADGDSAGRRMAEKIHYLLDDALMLKLMRCPVRVWEDDETGEEHKEYSDPGSMTDEEIVYAFENAEVILGEIRW